MTDEQLKGLRDAIDAKLAGRPWQWMRPGDDWKNANTNHNITEMAVNSYKFRAKPEPRTRPWNCPADVPGPVCWVRIPESSIYCEMFVTGILDTGCNTPQVSFDWESVGRYQYSTTRRADDWHPCTVEEAA